MSKSTLFIALQCYQCSTMQVKQQKKSSNKWTCAVCNEKQSVQKIFAQSYQAKDIRHVVQAFNMSRKLADDYHQVSSLGHFVEHLEGDRDTEVLNTAKRRADWSEYVDEDQDFEPPYLKSRLPGKEMFEVKIVTELPEDLAFKKPKLKGGFGSSSSRLGESRVYKPQFYRKSVATKEAINSRLDNSGVDSDRNAYNVDDGIDLKDVGRQSQQHPQGNKGVAMMKTGASRWAAYLTEENGGVYCERETAHLPDDSRLTGGYKVQTEDADELVEEDIHPDFM